MKQLDELELMLEKQRETIENQRRQVKKAGKKAYKPAFIFQMEIRNLRFKNIFTNPNFNPKIQLIAERQQFHMEQIKIQEAARAREVQRTQPAPEPSEVSYTFEVDFFIGGPKLSASIAH